MPPRKGTAKKGKGSKRKTDDSDAANGQKSPKQAKVDPKSDTAVTTAEHQPPDVKEPVSSNAKEGPSNLTVDTSQANVAQNNTNEPAAQISSPGGGTVATAPADYQGPPVQSAGLPYTAPWDAEEGLISTVRPAPNRSPLPVAELDQKLRGFIQESPNMCYRNSVITALLNSQRFMSYVTKWHIPREDRSPPSTRNQSKAQSKTKAFRILHELDELSTTYWDSNAGARGGRHDDFMKDFWARCNEDTDELPSDDGSVAEWRSWKATASGTINEQQDTGEFLIWLLQAINGQLARDFMGLKTQSASFATQNWPQQNFSCITKIALSERGACPLCKYSTWHRLIPPSPTIENIMQLHMPSSTGQQDHVSLENCIYEYMNSTREVKCSRCEGKPERLQARFKFLSLPEVLFIHLNRQSWDFKKMKVVKNDEYVFIPEELDLSQYLEPYCYGEGSECTYRLSSVISHVALGGSGGHYMSNVRDPVGSSDWYKLDDSNVRNTTLSNIDDSTITKTTKRATRTRASQPRATPCLMVYEKSTEVRTPGRQPFNVGWVKDGEQPPEGYINALKQAVQDQQQAQHKPEAQSATSNLSSDSLFGNSNAGNPEEYYTPVSAEDAVNVPTSASNDDNPKDTTSAANDYHPEAVSKPASDDNHFEEVSKSASDGNHLEEALQPASDDIYPEDALTLASDGDDANFLWQGAGTLSGQFFAPEEDEALENAELFIRIRIGAYEFQYPRRVLEKFNPYRELELKVNAVLKAVEPKTEEEMYLELLAVDDPDVRAWRRSLAQGDRRIVFSKNIKPRKLKPVE